MNCAQNMDESLKNGGENGSGSATSALRALKRITSSGPRRLTESEIELLRQTKVEIGRRVRELLREKEKTEVSAVAEDEAEYE